MREGESLELPGRANPPFHPVDERLDVLCLCIEKCTQVEFERVTAAHIHVQGFLVDLRRIDPACQHKRCIHRPAPGLGQK